MSVFICLPFPYVQSHCSESHKIKTPIARAERDGTRAEIRFRLYPKRTSPFKSVGRQFSRLLAAEVCAPAWVMLDRPRSEVAWEYWLPTPFASFPFNSPPMRHRVPPGSERALPPFKIHCSLHFSHWLKLHNISTRASLNTKNTQQ